MTSATLEHVNVTVTDPHKTAQLLCELFGWHIRWHGDAINGGKSVHVGHDDAYLALYAPPTPAKGDSNSQVTRGGLNHIGVTVDDLEGAERRVLAAGFETHNHGDYEPGRRFYFNDDDGIEYEVVHYPSPSGESRQGSEMTPALTGIDHVHVYVADRDAARDWYADVLGMRPIEAYLFWAAEDGPLTLEDTTGSVHLALFERADHPGSTAIAFGATGEGFLAWKKHLEGKGITLRVSDHKKVYSMYFTDPDNNMHEITTCDYDWVAARL